MDRTKIDDESQLEFMWVGHASIMVRKGDVMVLIDPFFSPGFYWNGDFEQYLGDSPFIGTNDKMNKFLDRYGAQITAVAITHIHGDHCDLESLMQLFRCNPDLQLLAPDPVVKWLKSSGALPGVASQFLSPVAWNESIEVEGENDVLEIGILPNPNQRPNHLPARVGYFIGPPDGTGIVHPGDAHGIGDWDMFKDRIEAMALWGVKGRHEILDYFANSALKHVWWIHWEKFIPGHFSCTLDTTNLITENAGRSFETHRPEYGKWYRISSK